ncbi:MULTISPECIES: hypothetical protein [unclassified Microcoleus]|uniref:hypothetical protein n=1 Tax=unclassified Microcoleus TaxID=2642155 RepID=UPI002FD35786
MIECIRITVPEYLTAPATLPECRQQFGLLRSSQPASSFLKLPLFLSGPSLSRTVRGREG